MDTLAEITTRTRRKNFRAALALASMTQESWARVAGVTPGYLSRVLTGSRSSHALEAKIDAFTEEQLRFLPNDNGQSGR